MSGQRPVTYKELEALGQRLSRQIKAARIKAARGVSAYVDLLGTPSTFGGQAGKFAKVNADEDSIKFADLDASDIPDINDEQVLIEGINSPTYDDVNDWLNSVQSAGLLSGGEFTNNSDGSLTVAEGEGFVKISGSPTGESQFIHWDEDDNVSLIDNNLNYIYIDYNAGTPIVNATVTKSNVNHTTKFLIGKVYRDGLELHFLEGGTQVYNLARRTHERLGAAEGFERESGMVLSETGVRNIAITAGRFFRGLNDYTTAAFDSSGADTFSTWYYDGANWQETVAQSQIDNINYNDITSGLVNLTSNRYGVHWVYMHEDDDVHVVYGQGNYKLAEAKAALPPSSIPTKVSSMGILLAKIIIQKSAGSFDEVESAWSGEGFIPSVATDHGSLAGLSDDDHPQYIKDSEFTGVNALIGTGAGTFAERAIGIADNNIVEVDGTPADNEYTRWTVNGLEGRTYANVLSDLSGGNTLPTATSAAWSKTIGPGGDYADWATMIADMPDLIAHAVTVTIKKGTTLTETCDLKNKNGLTSDAQITVQAEDYFPQSGDLPTASSATATTLVDSSQAWAVDRFIDCWVLIVDGTGTDNGFTQITDSDATSITVASWSGTQPDSTSRYLIVGALVDGGGSRGYCFDIENLMLSMYIRGIGIKDATNRGIYGRGLSEIDVEHSGVYNCLNNVLLEQSGKFYLEYSGIVNASGVGIRFIATQLNIIYYCGFSDNSTYGVRVERGTYAQIGYCFGDNNGTWGVYCKTSGQAFLTGTECSGSSGNHSDEGTAGNDSADQAAAY